jgi:RimJ/RimL family protein N-acetyltransferase
MGMKMEDLTIRPISGCQELDLFSQLPYVLNQGLADDLCVGRRRTEWMWVALRADRLVGRAAWRSRSVALTPQVLDVLDIEDGTSCSDHVDIGVRLLQTAMTATVSSGSHPPEYSRIVPSDWRKNAAIRQATEDRMTVLKRAGARFLTERLRLEWRPVSPVPEPSRRLAFRPIRNRDELVTLMASALEGTLDAHGRDDLTRMSRREAASRHFEQELAHYTSSMDWWRIATLPHGEPVGFVIPARSDYNAIIAYAAVLPSHRGNGYIDDILGEGTRVLAELHVPRIRASTDLGNIPMVKAFKRAGYNVFEHQIDIVWC